jgi:glyoxalase/bleomycin resistance protein/dioxygenase superfamily protein
MHAELKIGDSRFMMSDVMRGMKRPKEFGGSPATLWLYVDDSDALFYRAVQAGAKVQMPVDNQFWSDRGGPIADPAGYTWWIATRKGRSDARGDSAARGGVLQADGTGEVTATSEDLGSGIWGSGDLGIWGSGDLGSGIWDRGIWESRGLQNLRSSDLCPKHPYYSLYIRIMLVYSTCYGTTRPRSVFR